MITKEQALTADTFHYTGRHLCTRTVGWKRDPSAFRVPVKYGLYESASITHANAHEWHTTEDCPLQQEHTTCV